MGSENEKLVPGCPSAILREGKVLNGSLEQAELKAWVEDLRENGLPG